MSTTRTNYASKPNREPATEVQKRWLSWNLNVQRGLKSSFSGIEETPAQRRSRVAARKRQKAARKANRG